MERATKQAEKARSKARVSTSKAPCNNTGSRAAKPPREKQEKQEKQEKLEKQENRKNRKNRKTGKN